MSHLFSIQQMNYLKKLDMNNVFILNASPIILLGKAGLLQTVGPLAELWLLPEGVVTEVESKRQIAPYVAELEYHSKVSREHVQVTHTLVASWDLGKGESEVLTLAMKRGTNSRAVLDDLQARKCAKLLNIGLIGSVGCHGQTIRFDKNCQTRDKQADRNRSSH